MTQFALYLDDGGHPDDQPFVVVAGYISTETQWLAFEPQWKSALARFDLRGGFHMTDFMQRRYSSVKREQILSTLASITKAHTLYPFVCGIDVSAYKRVNDEFALEECHGAPYALIARSLQRNLNMWKAQNVHPGDNLLIFVEEGTKHYGDLEQVFKRDSLILPNRVPKSMPQVQPADVLAWETFNWLRSGIGTRPGKNLDRLTRYIREEESVGGMIFEDDLRRICRDTDVYLRSALNPGDTIAFHSEPKRKRKRTIK